MPLLPKEQDILPETIFELTDPWRVAHVRSRQAREFARHLAARKVAFFLPQTEKTVTRAGRRRTPADGVAQQRRGEPDRSRESAAAERGVAADPTPATSRCVAGADRGAHGWRCRPDHRRRIRRLPRNGDSRRPCRPAAGVGVAAAPGGSGGVPAAEAEAAAVVMVCTTSVDVV